MTNSKNFRMITIYGCNHLNYIILHQDDEMLSDTYDNFLETIKYLEYLDLIAATQVNQRTWEYRQKESFWRDIIRLKFGKVGSTEKDYIRLEYIESIDCSDLFLSRMEELEDRIIKMIEWCIDTEVDAIKRKTKTKYYNFVEKPGTIRVEGDDVQIEHIFLQSHTYFGALFKLLVAANCNSPQDELDLLELDEFYEEDYNDLPNNDYFWAIGYDKINVILYDHPSDLSQIKWEGIDSDLKEYIDYLQEIELESRDRPFRYYLNTDLDSPSVGDIYRARSQEGALLLMIDRMNQLEEIPGILQKLIKFFRENPKINTIFQDLTTALFNSDEEYNHPEIFEDYINVPFLYQMDDLVFG